MSELIVVGSSAKVEPLDDAANEMRALLLLTGWTCFNIAVESAERMVDDGISLWDVLGENGEGERALE